MQHIAYKTPTKRYQARTKVNTIQWALFYAFTSSFPYLTLGYNMPVQGIYIEGIQYLSSSK